MRGAFESLAIGILGSQQYRQGLKSLFAFFHKHQQSVTGEGQFKETNKRGTLCVLHSHTLTATP